MCRRVRSRGCALERLELHSAGAYGTTLELQLSDAQCPGLSDAQSSSGCRASGGPPLTVGRQARECRVSGQRSLAESGSRSWLVRALAVWLTRGLYIGAGLELRTTERAEEQMALDPDG